MKQRMHRFGVERRGQLLELAGKQLGQAPTPQQAHIITTALYGLLSTDSRARQAFYNDPGFIGRWWKGYSQHMMSPGQKAAAAATQAHVEQPAGPQQRPGGGVTPSAKPPQLTTEQRLAAHHANLQKKYPGQYSN